MHVLLACVAALVISTTMYLLTMGLGDQQYPDFVCFCYYTSLASQAGTDFRTASLVALQLCQVFIYGVLSFINRRAIRKFGTNQARNSLNARFAMWANVKVRKYAHNSTNSLTEDNVTMWNIATYILRLK